MSFVVYNIETTRIEDTYMSETVAKRQRTRLNNQAGFEKFAYQDDIVYRIAIEKMVERTNMMTGEKYMESVNTPLCCSPSSDSYWSM